MEKFDRQFDENIKEIYKRALQGLVDSNDLTNTVKAHLLKMAYDKIDDFINGIIESINQGFTSIAMYGSDLEIYIKEHTTSEQSIIEWLTKPKELPIINNSINSEKTKKPTKKQTDKTTYLWQGTEDELLILYFGMIGKLIDRNNTFEQFEAVFTAKPLHSIETKINWLVANNLLAYFIDTLFNKKLLNKNIDNDIWAIAKVCFTKSDNLIKSKDLYLNNDTGKPKNYKIIDGLFIPMGKLL